MYAQNKNIFKAKRIIFTILLILAKYSGPERVALGLKKQKMKLKQNEEQIPFLGRGEKGPSTTGEKEVWFYKFVPF